MNDAPELLKSADSIGHPEASDRKRLKFKELAEKRTNKALTAIRVIGNLANRNSYSYKDDEVKKITKALRSAVSDVEAQFTKPEAESSGDFVL